MVESSDGVWNDILQYQDEISDYLDVIGLELIIKKDYGFAYLRQMTFDDNKTINLVSRTQIGFEVSLVIVVLRKMLADFDDNPTETLTNDKFVDREEIKEELKLFLPDKFDKVKFEDELDNYITRVEKCGFLKRVGDSDTQYKIHRIIEEKVKLDDLKEFTKNLQEYAANV